MGAVIGMDGSKANRKQLYDLALAGPVAGLFVAIPVLCLGIQQLDLSQDASGMAFYNPLLVEYLFQYLRPGEQMPESIYVSQLNPLFMAGWVGLLVTGLNMLPISQLDGGHVIYAVFGKRAHTIARTFLICTIAFIIIQQIYIWTLMLILVIIMGVDHPPTSDDSVELNEVRWRLGVLSLAIPILCFPVQGIAI
jgi:membrane-associated protease RseP (regulator of RpoE activity)